MTTPMQMEIVTGGDESLVAQLVDLQRQAFPPRMQFSDPERYYRDALEDRRHINVLVRNAQQTVTGYLFALPLASVLDELRPWDPQLREGRSAMYVDIIQTRPGQRPYAGFMQLVEGLCRETVARGYPRLAMHVRTAYGLGDLTLKLFSRSRCLRRIDNWFDSGEAFAYIEAVPRLRRPPKQQ